MYQIIEKEALVPNIIYLKIKAPNIVRAAHPGQFVIIRVNETGMCGACRVEEGGVTKFACVDGPDFDGHEVNWETLVLRLRQFIPQEDRSHMLWERENWHKLVEVSPRAFNPTLGSMEGEKVEKKSRRAVIVNDADRCTKMPRPPQELSHQPRTLTMQRGAI